MHRNTLGLRDEENRRLAEALGFDGERAIVVAVEAAHACLRLRSPEGADAKTFWTPIPPSTDLERTVSAMPTFVAVLARRRGRPIGDRFRVLSAPSPSHLDEEEIPSVALLVGETLAEAAERAAWEVRGTVVVEAKIIDEIVTGYGPHSERRVVMLGSLIAKGRPGVGITEPVEYPLSTLARGRFAFCHRALVAALDADDLGAPCAP